MPLPVVPRGLRTWIEVDRRAIRSNLAAFRKTVGPNVRLMAVAKSNAYGHGLIEFAQLAAASGADWLGVDSVVEAIALRRAGLRCPVLVLGATLPARLTEAARQRITLTVSTFEVLASLQRLRVRAPLRIHLKFDTGMHRQGFLPYDLPRLYRALRKLPPSVRVEGAYTHFPSAKNPALRQEPERELAAFLAATDALAREGFPGILRHAAATGGTLVIPAARLDLVRIGIGCYGLWPSAEIRAAFANRLALRPALSWRTVTTEVKALPSGSRIGYDGTEVLTRRSRIAVLPVGYWHGYPRALSGIGQVVLRGRRCRVLGRVSMDMLVVDVTRVPGVRVGDVATLIGQDGTAEVTADALASLAGTISYEIVTRLNPLMHRVYR